MVRKVRVVLWIAVAIAAMLGLYLTLRPISRGPEMVLTGEGPSKIGGPFTLIDASGKPFSSMFLAGQPYVIFFGFTHCPDVCPTTLARLARLRKNVGGSDDAFQIVFVTVDPERDGPAQVGAYAKAFNTPIIGLTGSAAQIDTVKQRFGIFSQKTAVDPSGDYGVDHTATVFLMDRNGDFTATIAPDESDPVALEKLKRIAS